MPSPFFYPSLPRKTSYCLVKAPRGWQFERHRPRPQIHDLSITVHEGDTIYHSPEPRAEDRRSHRHRNEHRERPNRKRSHSRQCSSALKPAYLPVPVTFLPLNYPSRNPKHQATKTHHSRPKKTHGNAIASSSSDSYSYTDSDSSTYYSDSESDSGPMKGTHHRELKLKENKTDQGKKHRGESAKVKGHKAPEEGAD